jgi:SAM-dependent methyltransferase
MTTTFEAAAPDLAALKRRQQAAWASGDFHVVAARIVLVAEHLCDSADLRAGWRVLDVATGSGNAAIAAARLGCHAVGVDYVPALLERGLQRAATEGLDVGLLEGDAEALPFPDRSFDAVLSVFGAMFAPDHARAAAELVRVCRPGGTIALASWTPQGFVGELFRTVAGHVPPPAGVASPMLWGAEAHLRELFGGGITSLEVVERTFTFRFRSADEFVEFFRTWYGPTVKAFAALDADGRGALRRDLVARSRAATTGSATPTRSPSPPPTRRRSRPGADATADSRQRTDLMKRVSIVLSATALVVALFGSTPVGKAVVCASVT